MHREIGPLGRADKVIEKVTMFAALHESVHGTFPQRGSRANQCPVSGVKQPCRRNPETAEFNPELPLSDPAQESYVWRGSSAHVSVVSVRVSI
jgi:hypothetical protein